MIQPVIASLLLWVSLAAACRAEAAAYYVEQRVAAASDENAGTEAMPWKTIGHAAAIAQAGDTVLIGTGIYRERLAFAKSGAAGRPICFQALPAANVVLSGADRIDHWQRETINGAQVNVTDWPHSFIDFSPHHTHPDDEYHRLIGRAEQVLCAGYPLRQVLNKAELARGTFFVDLEAKKLYVRNADDQDLTKADALVEASVRDTVIDCAGDFVTLRGIRLRYAANRAQEGAAVFRGAHDVIEECTFERANAVGASFVGTDQVVRRCQFRDNGQMGFSAVRAHRLLFTECEVRCNNIKGFDRGWEAGGDKLVLCRGAILDHSIFADNRGSGVWFDMGNEDCEVRNCLIADNEDAGIFDEISIGLKAHDNAIVGNGFAETPGSWGAAAGICLSSSPGSVVERNLLVGNREGFDFREQRRTTPRIDAKDGAAEEPIWNHDDAVRNNVLAYNRDAQVWGWFDVNDQRHWPRTMWAKENAGTEKGAGPPAGTSLADLKLQFAGNVYAVRVGEGLFNWGPDWGRRVKFAALDDVRRELSFEHEGVTSAFEFASYARRDFRVPKNTLANVMKCYPQGSIPGTTLGASD